MILITLPILLIVVIILNIVDGYFTTITPEIALYCKNIIKNSVKLRKNWNNEICGFPLATNMQAVGFIALEGSFPFNTPKSILKNAGIEFRQGVTLHSGIAIIIATSSIDLLYGSDPNSGHSFIKFSIEFCSNNYTGSIFPYKNNNGNNIQWNNNASINVRNPLDTNLWLNSRIITETTGLVYNEFIYQIYENILNGDYNVFQPITIISPNISSFETLLPITQNQYGSLLISSISSSTLVNNTISFLLSKECTIGAFLNLASTSIFYFQCTNGASCKSLETVPLNDDVYIWYENLHECLVNFNGNGAINWQNIQNCYNLSYAYVYMNSTFAYKVDLLNVTEDIYHNTTIYNPMIFRYILQLQSLMEIEPKIGAMDTFWIVCFFLIISFLLGFIIYKIFFNNSNKSKSKEDVYLDNYENRIKQDSFFEQPNIEALKPMIELKSINK